ncbi:MAG: ATP-binding protein [Chloroflexi bacterium]|nr:ATP-binding protein [Chloroflexota bacterium]
MTTERPLLEREAEYRPAVPATLEAIHFELDQFWAQMTSSLVSSMTDRWKLEFTTALAEICANVIQHAFAEPHRPGTMALLLRLYNDRVEAEITDDGAVFHEGFATADPAPDQVADLPESGRGLQVARALLDTLRYRRSQESENQWLLVKMLPQ